MKPTLLYLFIFLALCFGAMSCDAEVETDDEMINENIFRSPDYEDSADGDLDWEDQSARSEYTDATSNPVTDPLKDATNPGWVVPRYTDNEYEPAFSTSSTNPQNQIHELDGDE